MAEGNANRPAPETLTTEDVERLAERFKPSWETEPQMAPRPEPARPALKQTMVGGTAPAAPLAPARPAPTPAAPAARAPAPAAPPAAAPSPAIATPAAKPMATVSVGKSIEVAKPVVRHPTLVGIAPQAIRQVSGAPQAAPDDLDWELPPGEQPQPPSDMAQTTRIVKAPEPAPAPKAETSRVQQVKVEPAPVAAPAPTADEPLPVDIEELPPESKPSGIGQTYVPRDQNAPAVVLNEDVKRTEEQTLATIEAQHRARSAPTVARMPAVRVAADAAPVDFADEDTITNRRKSRKGVWAVLAVLALGAVGAAAVAVSKKSATPEAAAPATVEKPAAAAETAAPPPPTVTAEPPAPPPELVASAPAEPAGSTAPATPEEPAKVAAAAPPAEAAAPAPKRASAPTARPTKPKPAATSKTSTSSSQRSKPAVIVRDNPF